MIETILIEGLIYGIMVLGLFISFRTLNFCDMTVDGAFPMGGCILAACLSAGLPPYAGILLAFTGGCLSGLCTTLLYTKLRVPDLLAGILMMTMLYSINLRIMSNRANISFLRIETTFSRLTDFFENKLPDIPAETVERELRLKEPTVLLPELQKKGFLENINYDYEKNVFHTYIKQEPPQDFKEHTVRCGNCGAAVKLTQDSPDCCPYCDAPLSTEK